ncbi:hypothetical protein B566_EDAN014921 [Ephemera danica]|nr:hypothetical protein B566_EDAN014921 [Ephemera danica]
MTHGTPYALNVPVNEEPSKGQTKFIKEIFKGKRDLFFVECGANDGEFASNTLFFERQWGWTGLLIEPDPVEIPRLLSKQRQAWVAPVCLSFDKTPSTVRFEHVVGGGGQVLDPKSPQKPNEHLLQCVPFYTLLLAMNRTRIDYFSLDVEGAMVSDLK